MKTYGSVIKLLRKNKSLSQQDISTDILSRTTISKIENNSIIPTITTLEAISIKLDVTLDEITFIRNNFQLDKRNEIISDFLKLVSNTQTELVTNIISRINHYLKQYPDDSLLTDIKYILLATLHLINDEIDKALKLVKPIWERLEKIDQFSLIEIRLVSNILFFFPTDIIKKFIPRLLVMIDKYIAFDKTLAPLKVALLINTASIFMEIYPDTTTKNLEIAINTAKEINRFDLLANAYYLQGVHTQKPELVNKAKNIFYAIEQTEVLAQLENNHLFQFKLDYKL
ncbi:helix-turn-helix domain-containing protein [Listeria welshimeri]|uniref:helix-turn-helix domain-containing protein n=1 Tax=Listeria welshimeri TaxID=1643 RepID=UPI001623A823|nr:helix-turn-helix transcriptional regulator [Listeria welshimeri]MBC1445519.1 helix-turn-helix domain-containing protein [Listeria welshimeri]MBF2508541.1 helix-turn-helix domain-containing protein [Listeria welshimeri]MBF2560181.1 helix-turn-helix domain-containing protein [Listeria welshimeri]MBF2565908.1 helix-turn-helix domain-containing protein [Listeria welshimeri]MBF2579341.1 helix-turn-helix domain-containing protein [Listeria welshimeri]